MSVHVVDDENFVAAEQLIASITKPDAMNPAVRGLVPAASGVHRDTLTLALANATLAQASALREIAWQLDEIRLHGIGQHR